MAETATQTYHYNETTVALKEKNKQFKNGITSLKEKRDKFKQQRKSSKLTADSLSGDKETKFLNGLPSYFMFITLFTLSCPL